MNSLIKMMTNMSCGRHWLIFSISYLSKVRQIYEDVTWSLFAKFRICCWAEGFYLYYVWIAIQTTPNENNVHSMGQTYARNRMRKEMICLTLIQSKLRTPLKFFIFFNCYYWMVFTEIMAIMAKVHQIPYTGKPGAWCLMPGAWYQSFSFLVAMHVQFSTISNAYAWHPRIKKKKLNKRDEMNEKENRTASICA